MFVKILKEGDTVNPLLTLSIIIAACVIVFFVAEFLDIDLGDVFCAIIGIAIVVGIGYFLYVKVCYPAYLACCRFIDEHLDTLIIIVLGAVALVLLIIFLWNLVMRYHLLTTDYNAKLRHCNREIANATEALRRAKMAEEDHRRCDEFEMLAPGRYRYGYTPNRFEREVAECVDTLNRLRNEKRYYEEQLRKANKLRNR